jgi:hypothetical protein
MSGMIKMVMAIAKPMRVVTGKEFWLSSGALEKRPSIRLKGQINVATKVISS